MPSNLREIRHFRHSPKTPSEARVFETCLKLQRRLLTRFPFGLIYTNLPDEVVVIAIAHGDGKGYFRVRYFLECFAKLPPQAGVVPAKTV